MMISRNGVFSELRGNPLSVERAIRASCSMTIIWFVASHYSYIATPVYPLIIIRKQAYTHQYIAIYIHREESGRPTARHECAEQKLAGNCFLNYVCGFL